MNTSHRYEVGLAARGMLEIPDVAGVRVTCSQGSLWLTLDNDQRDIVLEPGETFFSTDHRRAIVYAFRASNLALRAELEEAEDRVPSMSFMRPAVAG
jgi:hypothetical protein